MESSNAHVVVVCLLAVIAGCGGPANPMTETSPTAVTTETGTTTAARPTPPTDRPETTVPSPRTEWTVTVTEVVDGDTMDVRFENGTTETVRLLGVDTPEVHVANDPAEFEGIPESEAGEAWLRGWGENASEFARAELAGETVTIALDPAADRRGSYGRLLVYIERNGELFNRQLLARGYARHYDAPLTRADEFRRIEQRAREMDVGLWNYPEERAPARFGGPHAA